MRLVSSLHFFVLYLSGLGVSGFFKIYYLFMFLNFIFVHLFLAALGLHCCVRPFSSCGERGLLFVAVRGLLIVGASHCGGFSFCGTRALGAQASVVVARGLSRCGSRALERSLSSCGAQA